MYANIGVYRALFDDLRRWLRRMFHRIDWASVVILSLCMLMPGIIGGFFGVALYVQFFAT